MIQTAAGIAARAAIRATLGAAVAAKAKRADNWEAIGQIAALRASDARPLGVEDFKAAADREKLDAAALHALAAVETGRGSGFGADGRLTILYEPHVFSVLTAHAFDAAAPVELSPAVPGGAPVRMRISYPKWIPYKRGAPPPKGCDAHPYTLTQAQRWELKLRAAEVHFEAGLSSSSAGRFQQLIRGWRVLGFGSAEALLKTLAQSEAAQFSVLMLYLRANGLVTALNRRDWLTLAAGYNGKGQAKAYAASLATEYKLRKVHYA